MRNLKMHTRRGVQVPREPPQLAAPHPLPVTMAFIYEGLKRLRAVNALSQVHALEVGRKGWGVATRCGEGVGGGGGCASAARAAAARGAAPAPSHNGVYLRGAEAIASCECTIAGEGRQGEGVGVGEER
jgi:hypothetical protein